MMMRKKGQPLQLALCSIVMLLLILDAKTALTGAREGIFLCIYSVLPSLFPFLIVSQMLTSRLVGTTVSFLRPISKLCAIPKGAETILLLGFLGGYPVGAQAVTDACRQGHIDKDDANRLLGFCNNVGPSFLFGMFGPLFSSLYIPWALWFIHILSALTVGAILPNKKDSSCKLTVSVPMTLPQAMERAIRIMANICGWVIAFRVIIAVLSRWFLWLLPLQAQILTSGLLELSNGCHALRALPSEASRFIISSAITAWGGLCVGMQTVSVTGNLGTGAYFPGKVLQCLFSVLLASLLLPVLFKTAMPVPAMFFLGIAAGSIIIIQRLFCRKKTVAICS